MKTFEGSMSKSFEDGHALLIGVGDDLPNTANDALGLANILKDRERCAYLPDQVNLVQNKAADQAGILASLDKLASEVDESSTVMVYFSGHGYHVKSHQEDSYYLMPHGYDMKQLKETAISGTEFIDKLKAIRAQKMLLLLDCCHAGGITNLKDAGFQLTKVPMPPEAHSLLAQGSGHAVIASSKANEYSFAADPYSVFTYALIEALCGIGASQNDGFVRVADLALHASEVVPKLTKDRQHPILDFSQADNFVLSYYASGEMQIKGLPFTGRLKIQDPEQALGRTIPDISDEAQMFLKKASKTVDGMIYRVYWGIQIGRKNRWEYQKISPRERAVLGAAIDELERFGLIKDDGSGEVFMVTNEGYIIADMLNSESL